MTSLDSTLFHSIFIASLESAYLEDQFRLMLRFISASLSCLSSSCRKMSLLVTIEIGGLVRSCPSSYDLLSRVESLLRSLMSLKNLQKMNLSQIGCLGKYLFILPSSRIWNILSLDLSLILIFMTPLLPLFDGFPPLSWLYPTPFSSSSQSSPPTSSHIQPSSSPSPLPSLSSLSHFPPLT